MSQDILVEKYAEGLEAIGPKHMGQVPWKYFWFEQRKKLWYFHQNLNVIKIVFILSSVSFQNIRSFKFVKLHNLVLNNIRLINDFSAVRTCLLLPNYEKLFSDYFSCEKNILTEQFFLVTPFIFEIKMKKIQKNWSHLFESSTMNAKG